MAYLVTFSVLLGGAAVWMGLYLAFDEADSATLNALAEWLSPLRVSGWAFYLALCAIGCVPLARRLLRRRVGGGTGRRDDDAESPGE